MTEVPKKRNRPVPDVLPEYARRVIEARGGSSRTAFADQLGVTPMVISHWEKGRNGPSPAMLVKLAEITIGDARDWFAASAHRRMFGDGPIPELTPQMASKATSSHGGRQIDVYASAGAGPFLFIEERKLWEIELPVKWFVGMGEIAGVVVKGDSMEPVISSGHIVLIDRGRRSPADCVDRIVAVSDGDGVSVKWLRRSGKGYLLVPNNQTADNTIVPVTGDHSIIGCAVRWIAQAPYTVIAEGEGMRA